MMNGVNLFENRIKTILLLVSVIAVFMALSGCQMNQNSSLPDKTPLSGRELAEKLKKNVVRITVERNNGQDNGFGFVVGGRDNRLYVATARHVIRGETDDPDVEIKKIEAQFFEEQGKRFEALHLDLEKAGIDLALLEVPKPFPGYE